MTLKRIGNQANTDTLEEEVHQEKDHFPYANTYRPF